MQLKKSEEARLLLEQKCAKLMADRQTSTEEHALQIRELERQITLLRRNAADREDQFAQQKQAMQKQIADLKQRLSVSNEIVNKTSSSSRPGFNAKTSLGSSMGFASHALHRQSCKPVDDDIQDLDGSHLETNAREDDVMLFPPNPVLSSRRAKGTTLRSSRNVFG